MWAARCWPAWFSLGGGLLREIAVYDPNEALCARCEMEFNQILSPDGTPVAPGGAGVHGGPLPL